jgi:hypothetical protein
MTVVLKQNADGSMGLQGVDLDSGQFVKINIPYTASSVDMVGFIASRRFIVQSIVGRPEAAGTDAGAVTCVVKKAASGTAIASGTALHSGTFNLKGTAATNQALTVDTTANAIPAGTAIGIDFTGTLTAAAGVITITLCPA